MTFDIRTANQQLQDRARRDPRASARTKTGAELEICRDFGALSSDKHYTVLQEGQEVARARLYGIHNNEAEPERGAAFVSRVEVEQGARRQGIATALYDLIASDLRAVGADLQPSQLISLSGDAIGFWTARTGEHPADFHKRQFRRALALYAAAEIEQTDKQQAKNPPRSITGKVWRLARLKWQRRKLKSLLDLLKTGDNGEA